jgi:hypothetical protein
MTEVTPDLHSPPARSPATARRGPANSPCGPGPDLIRGVRGRTSRWLALLCAALATSLAACRADAPAPALQGIADDESPPELVAMLADLLPRVERISGLDRIRVLRMRRQGREEARRYVESRLDAELPPERLDGVRRSYVALGLIPDTLELRSLLLELYTEQVLGYYDPATETLYVLEGEDPAGLRPLLAHELVHALQDQHADLDALVARERGNDAQTAAHAALEGHATVVMFAVLAEEATRRRLDPVALPDPAGNLAEALAEQDRQFPVFGRTPRVIRETLMFPYVAGASFVHQLWSSMAPMDRYPAPLDSLLPRSTRDILEPHRLLQQNTAPLQLQFAPPAAPWTVVYENDMGRLETGIFLDVHAGDGSRDAAAGWAGDRFLLLSAPGAGDLLYWVTLWESDAAGDLFARAARRGAPALAPRRMTVETVTLDGVPAVVVTIHSPDAGAVPLAAPAARVVRE